MEPDDKSSCGVESKSGQSNPHEKSIAKNSAFFLIYNLLNIIFPFVTGIYVARVLLPDGIGQVAYAQNVAQYFVILAFLGIPTYGLREISKARKDKEELNNVYSELFFLNLISTVTFTCIYIAVIFSVPDFRNNYPLYLITGLAIALNAFDISWLYEGLEEFKFISVRNLIFKIASFVLLMIFVRNPDDFYIYAAITVTGTAGNNILNIAFSRKFVRLKFRDINIKRHLKPVIMLVVVNLAIEIYTLVDTTMLGAFCPKENVAFYTYGSRINKIFLQVVNTFTIVIVPRIALYYKEKKYEEFNALLTQTLKIILILGIPLIVGIQFVAKFFICEIYGQVYINSAYVLRILSAVLLISPIGYLLGSRVILSVGKEWKMIVSVGVGAAVNVIGNVILIPLYKEYGAAITSVVGEIVVTVIYLIFGSKYFKLQRFWDTAVKAVIASACMGGYLYGASFIPLNGWGVFAIQVLGAIIIYFGLLLLFREHLVSDSIIKFKNKIFKRKIKEKLKETEMKELTLPEIQQCSFKILLEFKNICEKNNFQYFLAYGTLIGAIRHKGFIPWDDDIDVWMPRPDYDKFVQFCIDNESSLGVLALKHFKSCKEYIYPIARLVDTRYKIEYTDAKEYGLGLFIDIYPLDGVNGADKSNIKKIKRQISKVACLGKTRFVPAYRKWKNIFKLPYYFFNKRKDINKLIKKLDLLGQKYDYAKSEIVGCAVWEPDERFNREDFSDCTDMIFCDYSFKVPVGYDNLLKQLYGDYMQLPPENDRKAHHYYRAYERESDIKLNL